MSTRQIIKLLGRMKNKLKQEILVLTFIIYSKLLRSKNNFSCPICNYYGPFLDIFPETGRRKNAKCPRCGGLERHRLQYLVLTEIFKKNDTSKMSLLHFAPEKFFQKILQNKFRIYITTDLYAKNAGRKEDLTHLSFNDNSFDFIYASHVLEHIKNDLLALSEIRRVLKPGGIAIIPVPIICKKTIEYPTPNSREADHVRCPGEDYYERYRHYFNVVKLYKSSDFDEKYQLYIYENRTKWPKTMPLRPSAPGVRHIDIVPVCYK